MMKICFVIIAAWTGAFALVPTELAQAAYPGSDWSKSADVSVEIGANNHARDPIYHQLQMSFRTEVRKFEFPNGIIVNQTGTRNGKPNYHHSESHTADVRNRHGCHDSAGICTRWNKVHPRRHRPRP
jgi:hypothetical protein